jgi:hypothetical protein
VKKLSANETFREPVTTRAWLLPPPTEVASASAPRSTLNEMFMTIVEVSWSLMKRPTL